MKELAWTGRVIDGTEASQLGLVTAIHEDPAQAAQDTAAAIAARSPNAIRAIKQLFDESAEMSTSKALQLEAQLQISLLGGHNQVEAVTANLESRDPDFDDSAV